MMKRAGAHTRAHVCERVSVRLLLVVSKVKRHEKQRNKGENGTEKRAIVCFPTRFGVPGGVTPPRPPAPCAEKWTVRAICDSQCTFQQRGLINAGMRALYLSQWLCFSCVFVVFFNPPFSSKPSSPPLLLFITRALLSTASSALRTSAVYLFSRLNPLSPPSLPFFLHSDHTHTHTKDAHHNQVPRVPRVFALLVYVHVCITESFAPLRHRLSSYPLKGECPSFFLRKGVYTVAVLLSLSLSLSSLLLSIYS